MGDYVKGAFALGIIIAFSMAGSQAIDRAFGMTKECTTDSDCGSESYCGSDFECHKHPVITKTEIYNDYTTPVAILGFAIVISTLILRKAQK